ncbi:hypothetical protein CLOSTMETH_03646 [[Clostridium] methylpentosum DSM 5476]|uniref:Uncharacterized protein n=1 Tax=[Clostridium] methylpentosum DSM 5476 TaxID=537013 RepID=C0EIF0_9FIRM|nr:hypothetical protein CLOSTMETH_03646 [[Clostridium] methylpentosum DSM 5476]
MIFAFALVFIGSLSFARKLFFGGQDCRPVRRLCSCVQLYFIIQTI